MNAFYELNSVARDGLRFSTSFVLW